MATKEEATLLCGLPEMAATGRNAVGAHQDTTTAVHQPLTLLNGLTGQLFSVSLTSNVSLPDGPAKQCTHSSPVAGWQRRVMLIPISILLLLLLCCCSPLPSFNRRCSKPLRVRKELRNLTPKEYQLFVMGLSTMVSVNTEAGQEMFGPRYKEMDYFIIKHAIATQTPVDGVCCFDIAHFGPWFMNFHQAFIMEFENALLSVVPELKALPYWEMYEDFKGTAEQPGAYYNTSKSAFTNKYLGKVDGDPARNYNLNNVEFGGVFGGRMVPKFNAVKYAHVSHLFNGSLTGMMRDPKCNQTDPYLIRFPVADLVIHPSRAYMAAGLELNFTRWDLQRCADPSLVKDSWDFMMCIDLQSGVVSGLPAEVTDRWQTVSRFSHAMFHNIIGSINRKGQDKDHPIGSFGDARVVNTSPNEILSFFPFHSNLVRVWMMWKAQAAERDPKVAEPDVLWGYPRYVSSTPPITLPGTALDDVLHPSMPFTDIFDHPTPHGVTHRDMLLHKPDYTYDRMV